jgi:hypothetical protein
MAADSPRLDDLLSEAMAAALGRVRVAMPAVVLSYDGATQTVTAKPAIMPRRHDPDTDELVPYELPAIANVPVMFHSSSLGSLTIPLVAGDFVFLLVADRSLDEWKATGNELNVPQDVRRFDWTDVVAIPGGRPIVAPLGATKVSATGPVLAGDDVRLGSGAASDFVALASLVFAELQAIRVAFNAHTHNDPASGTTGVPIQTMGSAGSVAATKVKAV